jgi:peptidyl-prolyl cis-trans isomerase A (cyclophilin A)
MKNLILFFLFILTVMPLVGQKKPSKNLLTKQAPDSFLVRFETTKGNFTAVSKRSWSPKAVDRFYQLVRSHYYDANAIFRVQTGYVAQFGISNDSLQNNFWDNHKVADEPVIEKNKLGAISFARGGPETRTTQLFINLHDNAKLDTIVAAGVTGYPVIARIKEGLDVLPLWYGGYGFEPAQKQDSISHFGNTYLKKRYPLVDYILKVELVKK